MAYVKLVLAALLLIMIFVASAILGACAKPTDSQSQANLNCQEKARRGALDELCIIEISKAEIAKRFESLRYSKYRIQFNARDQQWVVMAYNEDGPPDSHIYLLISSNGKVERFGNRE